MVAEEGVVVVVASFLVKAVRQAQVDEGYTSPTEL
jgi:hypothetical protein